MNDHRLDDVPSAKGQTAWWYLCWCGDVGPLRPTRRLAQLDHSKHRAEMEETQIRVPR